MGDKTIIFNSLLNRFIWINKDFLYTRTASYLTGFDDQPDSKNAKIMLPLTQTGVLHAFDKDRFVVGKFDEALLNMLSRFRKRCLFVFEIGITTRIDHPVYDLKRIVITSTSPEERSEIDYFIGNNLDKYKRFHSIESESVRAIPGNELLIDIDLFREISKKPIDEKVKIKDIVLRMK